jgi:hypothetical protein
MSDPSLAVLLVRLLESYHKALPVEFLAHEGHRGVEDIEPYLTALEAEGVIARRGDLVELTQPVAAASSGGQQTPA